MRYLCLVYVDREIIGALTPEQSKELQHSTGAMDDDLIARQKLIHADALAEPETAVTIRRRGDTVTVTDGPFAETKEHLGGFMLIDARDMTEALEIAKASPMTAMGAVELRAIWDYRGGS